MIWGDIARNEDGSLLRMTYEAAVKYCKDIGAQLPSGYPREWNGEKGFPDEDSDFARLRKYMEDAEGKYKAQVLPNLTYTRNGEIQPYYFWSDSIEPIISIQAFGFNGQNGNTGTDARAFSGGYVRCVVKGKPNKTVSTEHIPPAQRILSPVERLSDPDPVIRRKGLSELGGMGKEAENIAPQIAELLVDSNLMVRYEAATTLRNLGEHAVSAVPRIVTLLETYPQNSNAVRSALRYTGPNAVSAVPALEKLLEHKDPSIRWFSLVTLDVMDENAVGAAPSVAALLGNNDKSVRNRALDIFEGMGEQAVSALPKIIPLLGDESADVREHALSAINNIGKPAATTAFPHVMALLKDDSEWMRYYAIYTFERMGRQGKARQQILEMLKDKSANVRYMAESVLRRMDDAK